MTKQSEKALGILWLTLCAGTAVFFLIFCRDAYLDSDMSSELILAELLSREGGILSKNWFYSTELRVLNTQLVTAPLFRFFDNWHTVRVLSSLILWAILIGSYGYMLHGMGLSRWFLLTAGFFFLPYSDDYYYIILMGCYYIPHICISLLTLGILFHLEQSRHRRCLLAAACFLAFAAGLGGIRQPVILYVPLCLAAFILFLCRPAGAEKRILIFAVILLLFSGLGYIGNRLLSREFSFFSFDHLRLGLHPDGLLAGIRGLLGCLGFEAESFDLPRLLLALAALAALAVLWVLLWRKRAGLRAEEMILTLFLPCSLVILCGIYTVSSMEYTVRYFLPCFVFFFPLPALALHHGCSKRCTAFFLFILAVIGFSSYPHLHPKIETDEHREMVAVLQKENYTQGFASFWNSNILTEYSNGEIETWTFLNSPSNIFEWLQNAAHAEELPAGKCFLLLQDGEGPVPDQPPFYETGNYALYGFEDPLSLRQYFFRWFESFDSPQILPSGGLSYAPYLSMPRGEYEVTVRGENLDKIFYDVYCLETDTSFPCAALECGSTEVRYRFFLPEITQPLLLRLFKTGNNTVALDEIELRYIKDSDILWQESFEVGSSYLTHGADSNGTRHLFPGGISFGPYLPLQAGEYLVEIRGSGLANASFDLSYDSGTAFLPYVPKRFDDSVISYSFTLYEDTENIELRVYNSSAETITLDDITVIRQEPF